MKTCQGITAKALTLLLLALALCACSGIDHRSSSVCQQGISTPVIGPSEHMSDKAEAVLESGTPLAPTPPSQSHFADGQSFEDFQKDRDLHPIDTEVPPHPCNTNENLSERSLDILDNSQPSSPTPLNKIILDNGESVQSTLDKYGQPPIANPKPSSDKE